MPQAGRPPRWAAGLAAFVGIAIVVAATVWLVLRPDTYVATRPAPVERASARPDLAAAALDRLEQAVSARAEGAVDDLAAGGAAASLRAVIANAASLDVADFTARYVDESGAVTPDGRWQAAVDLTWRFAGYDARPVREEVTVGFGVADGRAVITGFGGGDRRTPLWLTGAVTVRRTASTLVLGADAAATDRYAALARHAVPVVGSVISGWRGPLVVEVPRSEAAVDAALGAAPGTYSGVAAVTASVDGSASSDATVHVFVNPEVMGRLDGQGAQVVLSHEATHLATGAALNGRRPIWLTEGFADYVALRDVRLPLHTTAGQILAQVRREGPPPRLPDQADFDPHSDSFGAEYEAAWLVCRVLAEAGGERALVALYDRVGAGGDLDATLREEFGFGVRGLTRLWRQRLSDLAA